MAVICIAGFPQRQCEDLSGLFSQHDRTVVEECDRGEAIIGEPYDLIILGWEWCNRLPEYCRQEEVNAILCGRNNQWYPPIMILTVWDKIRKVTYGWRSEQAHAQFKAAGADDVRPYPAAQALAEAFQARALALLMNRGRQ